MGQRTRDWEEEGVCVEGPGASGSPSWSAVGTDWEEASFPTTGAEASGETGEACIAPFPGAVPLLCHPLPPSVAGPQAPVVGGGIRPAKVRVGL